MTLRKTQFVSLKKSGTKSYRNTKFIYKFVQDTKYAVRSRLVALAEKVNFDYWKRRLRNKLIDITFNAIIIALAIMCFRETNPFLIGIGVTLFFILLKSYVEEFLTVFNKR